jgi:hypothetical protein
MLDALANNPLLQLLLLPAAIAAAVWASNHREHRQRATVRASSHRAFSTVTTHVQAGAAAVQPTNTDGAWLSTLTQALHLLVIGHSQGGKTTLIHELARQLAVAQAKVVVCDPDAAPGLWQCCAVYGSANELATIDHALGEVRVEVERRRKLRGSGQQRTFSPLYLVIDEYQDIGRVGGCPEARPLVEDILRRGGKLNVHLIIGVQDKQVKTMGFEGHVDLRRNFTFVVEVRADRAGQRWATVIEPTDEEATATYAVTALPDMEQLVERATVQDRAPTGAAFEAEEVETPLENLPASKPAFHALESALAISDVPFSVEEIAQIAAMIARGGKGKTEVVQAMAGYSGRKHKAYGAYYDRVRAAIEMQSSNLDPHLKTSA